jgi:hypothetical protein
VIALVPGVRALLPGHASLEDPVAELRAACLAAVGRLGSRVRIVASDAGGAEVAVSLVAAVGAVVVEADETGVLLVGNGSAMRTEKAPGFLDERAAAFDEGLRVGLLAGRPTPDPALAAELWADVAPLIGLDAGSAADVLYDDAPFGVQYWVITWP